MWQGIWQRIIKKKEYLDAQNGFSVLNDAEAFRCVMQGMTVSKAEAKSALNIAIEEIEGFSERIKAIRGSNRDPEIRAQIALNSKYITRYLNEINTYERITDEQFQKSFPSLTFRDVAYTLKNLKDACDHFVARGPRFNPL